MIELTLFLSRLIIGSIFAMCLKEYRPSEEENRYLNSFITFLLRKPYKVESQEKPLTCELCQKLLLQCENRVQLICGHLYHTECLSFWQRYQSKCPTCENKVLILRTLTPGQKSSDE